MEKEPLLALMSFLWPLSRICRAFPVSPTYCFPHLLHKGYVKDYGSDLATTLMTTQKAGCILRCGHLLFAISKG